MTQNPVFRKSVTINANSAKVWNALTSTQHMKKWMEVPAIEINTDWKVGSSLTISGDLYGHYFKNTGTVLAFEQEKLLRYSHLNSLSNLPDAIESYSVLEFSLINTLENETTLTLEITNCATQSIYKHLVFFWNSTLEILKQFIENK